VGLAQHPHCCLESFQLHKTHGLGLQIGKWQMMQQLCDASGHPVAVQHFHHHSSCQLTPANLENWGTASDLKPAKAPAQLFLDGAATVRASARERLLSRVFLRSSSSSLARSCSASLAVSAASRCSSSSSSRIWDGDGWRGGRRGGGRGAEENAMTVQMFTVCI
jgi:hypothetical protein